MSSRRSGEDITARAPGKVNVMFRVGQPLEDGSHVVATLYQAVSLYDTVSARSSDTFTIAVQEEQPVSGQRADSNLAMRAAKMLARVSEFEGGVSLSVTKHIPRRAGMSGGAADAAAALVACNELWQLGYDRTALQQVAVELGSDVPFALEGGTALGTGRGDEFSQVLSVGTFHWVIAPVEHRLEEDAVVTMLDEHREAHSVFDSTPIAPTVDSSALHALRSGCPTQLAEVVHNDLQMATLKLSPESARVLELGEQHGALAGVTLATTSAVGFLVSDGAEAQSLAQSLDGLGIRAIPVEGPVSGARLIN